MTSVLTFNAHLRYIRDTGKFNEFISNLKPAYLLAYVDQDDHAVHINTMAALLPNTKIIARVYHEQDGAFHLPAADGRKYIASPADCINKWGSLGQGGKILNLLNEPGTYNLENTRILIDWCIQAINLAVAQNISLMIGNFSTGHPPITADGKQWSSEFDRLLQVLSENRNKGIYLGLHEYGTAEGRIGRINAMVKRCETLGIAPPNVIISEYGIDHSPNEADTLQGYRTRGMGGRQYADWLTEQIKDTYRPHIDNGILKALCIFSYGNSGGWQSFDVENDADFRTRLLEHKAAGVLETVVKPPIIEPENPMNPNFIDEPAGLFAGTTHIINTFTGGAVYRPLRREPRWDAPETQQVYKGSRIRIYDTPVKVGAIDSKGTEGRWKFVQKMDSEKAVVANGWMWVDYITFNSGATGTSEFPPVKDDPPPVEIPTPPPPVIPPPFIELDRAFIQQLQAHHKTIADTHAAIADMWGRLLDPAAVELKRAA